MTEQITSTTATSTDVTRVACPGCQTLLRFEPEALDFPANCAACDCRFTVGIYVRIACPNCHNGSKIRESYRGQQVRCTRCQHDFMSEDGIPVGAGGRLLVARQLDTDLPFAPETVQPFLIPLRDREGSRPSSLDLDRFTEAERLRIEAIRDRDRLACETQLLKAVLSRLVASTPEILPPRDFSEERNQFESRIAQLASELEVARNAVDAHEVRRLSTELSQSRQSATQAIARTRELEEQLAEVSRAHSQGQDQANRLVNDHGEAQRAAEAELAAMMVRIDRLNHAVNSARSGEFEALQRLEQASESHDDTKRLTTSQFQAERERHEVLCQVVDELQAELEQIRQLEKQESDLRTAERFERDREVEAIRQNLQARADQADAEADQAVSLARDQVAQIHAELETAEAVAEARRVELVEIQSKTQAEQADLAARLAHREQLTRNLQEQIDRLTAEKLERDSRPAAIIEPPSSPTEPEQVTAGLELAKNEAERRNIALVAELQRVKQEYARVARSNETLTDRVQQLLAEKMDLAESIHASSGIKATGRPISNNADIRPQSLPESSRVADPAPTTWQSPQAIVAGASIVSQAVEPLRPSRIKDYENERDHALTLLYGDEAD